MGLVEVFSGPERRRRWSDEERLQILADAFAPGAKVADTCPRYNVSNGLVYIWRQKLLAAGAGRETNVPEMLPTSVFAEALMGKHATVADTVEHPGIIIDLPRGKRLSIFAAASPIMVAAERKALR